MKNKNNLKPYRVVRAARYRILRKKVREANVEICYFRAMTISLYHAIFCKGKLETIQ